MKILFLILLVLSACSIRAQEPSQWLFVAPEGERFSFSMPQPVSGVWRELRFDKGLGFVQRVYEAAENDTMYYAVSFEKPREIGPVILRKFDSASDGFRYSLLNRPKETDLKILNEREFKLNGKKVKEFEFKSGNKLGVARFYDGEEHFFALVTLGGQHNSPNTNRFFDSFKAIKKDSKIQANTLATIKKLESNDPQINNELWVVDKPRDYKKIVISGGVLNSKILNPDEIKPYRDPHLKNVKGEVTVEVLVDETGKVISAKAIDGPGMLQSPCVYSALKAKFKPTLLMESPVKVSGTIVFIF